jgi:hypothetical protein
VFLLPPSAYCWHFSGKLLKMAVLVGFAVKKTTSKIVLAKRSALREILLP